MGACFVTTDPAKIDRELVYGFLSQSYWAKGIPREVLERAIANSLCFSLFEGDAQVGFARVATDRATFAYLADVFVLPAHRGRGLSKLLMETIVAHPDLQGLRRWVLVTRDAHRLYARYGFTPLAKVDGYMERWDPDVYQR
jgi:N-acetylglutamate synthase-like GNAT family acetyltransferase